MGRMKTLGMIAAAPAAWYLFSANSPEQFGSRLFGIGCLVGLFAFLLMLGKPPGLEDKATGATRAFPDDID